MKLRQKKQSTLIAALAQHFMLPSVIDGYYLQSLVDEQTLYFSIHEKGKI